MTAPRRVPVVLDSSVQIGYQLPRPRVGDLAAYSLAFSEVTEHTDPADPRVTTISVRVEPVPGWQPWRNPQYDGTVHERWPRWASRLHADGWAAQWVSFHAPPSTPGPVELRGRLTSDFGAVNSCWIRGRISRLWITAARRDRPADPWDLATWDPAWGSEPLIPMDEQPASYTDWPPLPTGTNETGWLVELDLDDVPDSRTGGVRR